MKINPIKSYQAVLKSTFLLTLLILTIQTANAQRNNIKVTALTFGQLNFSFESAIGSNHAFNVGLLTYNNDYTKHAILLFNNDLVFTNKGLRLAGEYRIYLSKKDVALKGMYFGLNASVGSNRIYHSNAISEQSFSTSSLGLKTGWQIHADRLLFDFGFNLSSNKVHGNKKLIAKEGGDHISFKFDMEGFQPQLYFGIGLAF